MLDTSHHAPLGGLTQPHEPLAKALPAQRLGWVCPSCQNSNSPDERQCPSCAYRPSK